MLLPLVFASFAAAPPLYVAGIPDHVEVVEREMSRDFQIVRGQCPDIECAQSELSEVKAPIGLFANATHLTLFNKEGPLASRTHDSPASLAVAAIELVDPSPTPRAGDLGRERDVIETPSLKGDPAPKPRPRPTPREPPKAADDDDSSLGIVLAACAGGLATLCAGFVGFATGCNPNNCGNLTASCANCSATCLSSAPLGNGIIPQEVPLARLESGPIAY